MTISLPAGTESLQRVRLFRLSRDAGWVNIRVFERLLPAGSECRAVPGTAPSYYTAGPEFHGHGETVETALQDCIDKVCAVSHADFLAHLAAEHEAKMERVTEANRQRRG